MRMRLAAIAAIAGLTGLGAADASAATQEQRIFQALKFCDAHFGMPNALSSAFRSAGWDAEESDETPLIVYTADERSVIAAFTRAEAEKPGCTAAAEGMPRSEAARIAEVFVRSSGDYSKHPTEKLTWIWAKPTKPVWFGVTRSKNFAIFRAPALAFLER